MSQKQTTSSRLDSAAKSLPVPTQTERKPVPRVLSYLRYSSSAQTQSDSIRRQLQLSESWAKERGLAIDETLRDEGVSAFRGTNAATGALASILRRIERNEIGEGSVLLVESIDRLSREQVRKALQQFLAIIDKGVTIVTLSDGREYSPERTDMLELMQSIMIMSRAHEESAIKSHRSKANWDRRRELAKEGKTLLTRKLPCWLQLSDKGKIQIDKAKAGVIRYVFELALKGHGVGSIVKRLNKEGIEPPAGGRQWYTRYVWRLFREPAVIGTKVTKQFQGKKRIEVDSIPGYYPPIIDEKVYRQVQALLSSRRNRDDYNARNYTSHHNIFQGVLKDTAGNNFTTFFRRKANIRYLVSMGAATKRTGEWHYLRQDLFEAAFLDCLVTKFSDSFAPENSPATNANLIRVEIDDWDRRISELENALASPDSDMPVPAILRALTQATKEKAAREKALKEIATAEVLTDEARITATVQRLIKLNRGQASEDERIEIGGIVRQLVKSATLKLSTEGNKWMLGRCDIEGRDGSQFGFRFRYQLGRGTDKKSTFAMTLE